MTNETNKEQTKHGILIIRKDIKKVVDFVECDYGRSSLIVLSGVRRNIDKKNYEATEGFIKIEDLKELKE